MAERNPAKLVIQAIAFVWHEGGKLSGWHNVEFTCGHCKPEIFALCPDRNCISPGNPTKNCC